MLSEAPRRGLAHRIAGLLATAIAPLSALGNICAYLLTLWLVPALWQHREVLDDAWRLVTVIVLVTMQGFWLNWQYRQPLATGFVSLGLWQLAMIVGGWETLLVQPGVLIAIFVAAVQSSARRRLLLLVLGGLSSWSAMLVSQLLLSSELPAVADPMAGPEQLVPVLVATGLAAGAVVAGPWLLGRWYAMLQSHAEELAAIAEASTIGEVQRIAQAVAAERRTLAMEIHDVSSAHLTAILTLAALGAQQPRHGLDAESQAEKARELFGLIDADARGLFQDYQRMLDTLQQPDRTVTGRHQPGYRPGAHNTRDLPELIAEHRAGAPDLVFTHTPDLATIDRRLGPMRAHIAYRVVQEALNNARKHAPGAAVEVRLADQGDALRVRIQNATLVHHADTQPAAADAQAVKRPVPSLHLGIAGVRDRITSVGGTLRTGPSHTGSWVVQVHLPHAPFYESAVGGATSPSRTRTLETGISP